jgi:DNA-binding beta-propeller fold protein YncE
LPGHLSFPVKLGLAIATLFSAWLLTGGKEPTRSAELFAPAGSRPVEINENGETVLPNGRLITPLGRQVKVPPHPYGLALSPDGKTLVTVNSGTSPFSISVITNLASKHPTVKQIPEHPKSADADPKSVFMGVAIAPDNRTAYVSEGDNGVIGVFDLASGKRTGAISLDGNFQGKSYKDSLPGELKLSPDGKWLYVLDLAHFRMVVIETTGRQIVASLPVGRLPFALALAPDGARAYVGNIGMFQYSILPGYDPNHARETALDFPPFGFPSPEAQEGTTIGDKRVPGLGDPNVIESNSLWVINLVDPTSPSVVAKLKTGLPVGVESVGGSSPGGVVAGLHTVFVSNSGQDSITFINAETDQIERTVVLEPAPALRGLRGVLPFGLALSPDEKFLYVACAGINAVAVVDANNGTVRGYLPTAWFPARLATSPDGDALYIANAKGFGAGPNGGVNFHGDPKVTYIGEITKGVVSIVPTPKGADLGHWTDEVLRNNGFAPSGTGKSRHESKNFPVPPPGIPSPRIHHVIFIVKENRTFDQVFGDLGEVRGEHVDADPALAYFGMNAVARNDDTGQEVSGARVTPNEHVLARRFAISDNYYVDSDVSVDGHHWLQGNYPNELVEAGWPASYGDELHFKLDSDAPGRLLIGGSSPSPQDYNQGGTIWHHLARHHITFRNYGEGFDLPGSDDDEGYEPTGMRMLLNSPMPKVLFDNTSRAYPMFNTQISDQYRVAQFTNEFNARFIAGGEPLPQFIFIWLPNDHTDKPRPADGYPFRASFVADNDLALGKLVELLSRSPYWKDTAIFVTEDDAQDGLDHVDAHRSLLLVISPYARRGVSHVHTSMTSILKTFDLILGIPYLNQYDAADTDLSDMFTGKPDFKPYTALASDKRIFDPSKVREPGIVLHARPIEPFDDPATIRRHHREGLNHD